MLANGAHHHNGSINGHLLDCVSDYEERPVLDVTPKAPRPGWKNAFPQYTHNLSWQDPDGCAHSMTLRSDSLSDLMGDLKLLKSMIKQSKAKASERAPQQTAQTQADGTSETAEPDVQHCRIHKVDMIRRWSKRTQGHYFGHKLPGGDFCYGKAK